MVISDYAPFLSLTCQQRLPNLMIGTGFCTPPAHLDEYPRLQNNTQPYLRERQVINTVNALLHSKGWPELTRLPALQPQEDSHAIVIPPLDPYHQFREEPAIGPLFNAPNILPRNAQQSGLFAYLSGARGGIKEALLFLAGQGVRVETYLRDCSEETHQQLLKAGVHARRQPINLAEALQRARVYMHHGNTWSTHEALAMGVPQVVMPIDMEKQHNAAALKHMGVSLMLTSGGTYREMGQAVMDHVADNTVAEKALQRAHTIHDRIWQNSTHRVLERVEIRLKS